MNTITNVLLAVIIGLLLFIFIIKPEVDKNIEEDRTHRVQQQNMQVVKNEIKAAEQMMEEMAAKNVEQRSQQEKKKEECARKYPLATTRLKNVEDYDPRTYSDIMMKYDECVNGEMRRNLGY